MNHSMNRASTKYRTGLFIRFLPLLILCAVVFMTSFASPAAASLFENRTGLFLSSATGFAGVEGGLNAGLHRVYETFSYDFAPGSLVAPKRLLPGFKINSKQFGKKIGKHAQDFGLNPSDPAARKFMQDKIESIVGRYDQVKQGIWRGGVEDAIYYRQGADVVVTKVDGSFITILKDGVNNSFFKCAGGL